MRWSETRRCGGSKGGGEPGGGCGRNLEEGGGKERGKHLHGGGVEEGSRRLNPGYSRCGGFWANTARGRGGSGCSGDVHLSF